MRAATGAFARLNALTKEQGVPLAIEYFQACEGVPAFWRVRLSAVGELRLDGRQPDKTRDQLFEAASLEAAAKAALQALG